MSDEMVSRRGLGWRVGVLGVAGPDPELLSDPVLIFVFCFFLAVMRCACLSSPSLLLLLGVCCWFLSLFFCSFVLLFFCYR